MPRRSGRSCWLRRLSRRWRCVGPISLSNDPRGEVVSCLAGEAIGVRRGSCTAEGLQEASSVFSRAARICPSPAIRRYGDTAIRRYGDTAIRRYGDTAIRRYGDTAIRRSARRARTSGRRPARRWGDRSSLRSLHERLHKAGPARSHCRSARIVGCAKDFQKGIEAANRRLAPGMNRRHGLPRRPGPT